MAKQLFIVYDKTFKGVATMLFNIISTRPDIKASIYTEKELNKLVSREKCLYIGRQCSSDLQFNDSYSGYGVNIGTMGTKAWVRCEPYKFYAASFKMFEQELQSYCEKYKMESLYSKDYQKDRKYILRQFIGGMEPWDGDIIDRVFNNNLANSGLSRIGDFIALSGAGTMKLTNWVLGTDENMIRKYQYILAVLIFFDKYFDEFIGPSESQMDNSSKSDTDEKKK